MVVPSIARLYVSGGHLCARLSASSIVARLDISNPIVTTHAPTTLHPYPSIHAKIADGVAEVTDIFDGTFAYRIGTCGHE